MNEITAEMKIPDTSRIPEIMHDLVMQAPARLTSITLTEEELAWALERMESGPLIGRVTSIVLHFGEEQA